MGVVWSILLAGILTGCSEGRDPQAFIKNLDAENASTRQKAVDELIRMREEAVPAVKDAFLNAPQTEAGVRRVKSAVAVLKETRTVDALETLAERADDENREIRLAVIKGVAELGQVRKKLGIDLLENAMDDPDGRIVQAAAEGLRRMNFEDATLVLQDFFRQGEGLSAVYAAQNLYSIDRRPAAASFLLEKSGASKDDIREAARTATVSLGSGRMVGERFIAFTVNYAIKNPDAQHVEAVLAAVRDNLFEQLTKTLPPKRIRAIMTALGRIAGQESVEKLISIVTSSEQDISSRIAAAEALGDAASSTRPGGQQPLKGKILDALKSIIDQDNVEQRIAIASSISLCRLRQEGGVRYLLDQLQSLEQTGEEEGPPVEPEDMTELRIRAQEALTTSGEFVVPYLLTELQEGDPGRIVAWAAARTLGDLRVKKAVPHLREMLLETVPPAEVPRQSGDPEGTLQITTENEPIEFNTTRSRVLSDIFGDQKVVPANDLSVRMAAARGLGRIGGTPAAKALEKAHEIHARIDEQVTEFLLQRNFTRMVPEAATLDSEKQELRKRLEELAQNIQRDAEKVLFYIRQGRKNLAKAPAGAEGNAD